jgi:hypothetical protein
LSKRQQKKLRKQEQWEAKKDAIKQYKKEQKKLKGGSKPGSHVHLMRFNGITKEEEGGNKLTK